MPDTVIETPQTQETPSQQSVQDINRQELYERVYGTSSAETTLAPESVAHTDPPLDPVVTPPVATIHPEVLQLMQSMQSELAELKSRVPTPAVPTSTPVDVEPAWIPLLREGKIKEAEDAMANSVMAKIKDQLQAQILEQSTTQTREVMRAEADIDRFTTELRSQNPELVPMEKLIAVDAQERMATAQKQGFIKTTDDAIRIYKSSVTDAVTSARKLYHTLRGDGKSEAQVRQREVLSSRPIPPQQVDTSRPQVINEQEPAVETPQDYLRKREEANNRRKGLAV